MKKIIIDFVAYFLGNSATVGCLFFIGFVFGRAYTNPTDFITANDIESLLFRGVDAILASMIVLALLIGISTAVIDTVREMKGTK